MTIIEPIGLKYTTTGNGVLLSTGTTNKYRTVTIKGTIYIQNSTGNGTLAIYLGTNGTSSDYLLYANGGTASSASTEYINFEIRGIVLTASKKISVYYTNTAGTNYGSVVVYGFEDFIPLT